MTGAEGSAQPNDVAEQQSALLREARLRTTERMVLIASVIAAGSAVTYAVLSFVFGAWQIFGDAVGLLGALACLLVARRAVRRGNLERAGYWILAATLTAFIPGELLWANQTLYFALSVLLLLGLVGNVIRPRRWWIWVADPGFPFF